MTEPELTETFYQRVCCGNTEALDFLRRWTIYAHAVDDIVDGDLTNKEGIIAAFIAAGELYTHPFFQKHQGLLCGVIVSVTNQWADTVSIENNNTSSKDLKEWAEHARHCGQEMVAAVAYLCGGWQHARSMSLEQRKLTYAHENSH